MSPDNINLIFVTFRLIAFQNTKKIEIGQGIFFLAREKLGQNRKNKNSNVYLPIETYQTSSWFLLSNSCSDRFKKESTILCNFFHLLKHILSITYLI